ncbi:MULTISPECIES: trifunctional serine/threonine-protein kinase/ATP-binding protein/sensor histidine kinase [Paraburkholderia]|uniref:trifunctional serine/threonine-protein kinase/ATP-binding protein/sensor histidine kinase n=1 Tax=Paraburkholderia TaxID=1822464 RepID=UPI00224DB85C|nr:MULTISPECIES: ATP-binding sensor histidine kinase [Paraburkholderia]MCX4170264.1 AAA family ATPase [Paraburkholderia madseniana]MDQ6458276.1 AAA family ATPase [Paraburkholderia madseniana]
MGNLLQTLWDDGERVFCRGQRPGKGDGQNILLVRPAAEHPLPASLDRLTHEFGLKDELDDAWAVRPLELVREGGQTLLVLEDPGGEPLARLLGAPMEMGIFLRLAVSISAALGKLHQQGLVHKDLKPTHILVNCADTQARLTGFGLASRLLRERQPPEPPETIAGTLAYMAPEQTGRMNRSIDSRSDLYAFGVTLYRMLTGALPFTAADPMEWVHCHIARKPVPPSTRMETVPAAVSHIVMKLLAKTAEERYQTAAGVERDLQHCLADWQRQRRVDAFPLGKHDMPDRLLIPEKLYGREREVDTLIAAFDRIVRSGAPELVLVSGYSGIGKSSVVNELHKVLVPPRGLFASGKFDQYKRDIPYSTLVQAIQSLVRPLLGKSDAELAIWRGAFLEALGPNARLMTDLIPELKLIIGDQPPIPALDPQQAQSRFQFVFRRFISVFARAEHPLALFLDDLQWLDAATLDLLEDLLTQADVQYLMLIGAYRDNEVEAAHPLAVKLQAIRNAGVKIDEIALAPLASSHVRQLIADALHREPKRIEPLAQLVHDKTTGNPFFVIQFLYSLAEEGLFHFDHDAACWSWDLDRIRAKGYTDNVVDLMVGKLTRLPAETQQALQQLACLGNVAGITNLSTVLGIPEAQLHAALWEALRHELVERLDGSCAFVHDRIQEAAYSLIPEASRAEAHLRIGRLLAAQTPPEKQEESIFEIVGQLNRGAALITEQDEREQLAGFNLLAGQRAKASTAYASALTYLVTGAELLNNDCWERRHGEIFALELNRAECEFLTGQLSVADERLTALSNRATTTVEQALVASLHIDVCTTLDQSDRAIAVCLAFLRRVSIEWPPHPTDEEVRREYDRIWSLLAGRTIEELIDLPPMDDPASLGTAGVLSKGFSPALYTDANLAALMSCKAVSLSLERGNCDASCFAYVMLGKIAGPRFGDYQAGFRLGQLGYELVERRGLKHLEARTYACFSAFVVRWMKHVRACRDLLRRAFEAANRIGDLTSGAYACNNLNSDLLFAGEPLPEVQGEAENGLAFAEKARFGLVIDIITTQRSLIRTLRGLTPQFGCLDDEQFDELRIERRFSENPELAIAACWYWIRKLQARYLAGDYSVAMDAASKAQPLLWTSSSFFEEAEYHFYGALAHAALCDSVPVGEHPQHLDAVAAHHRQLKIWAENCPDNFENRAALVSAEIARIEGRVIDAEQFYEQAIRSAQESGFAHNEALANELASRFYAARGLEKIARVYLQDARYGYLRWGADGKVRQLEERYPYLATEEPTPGPTTTIAASVEHLDLATVIKVSKAASGDIVLEKLIDMVMRTAIEQAGAERGLLVLSDGGEQRIAAEATTGAEATQLQLRDVPVSAAMLPESIVYHVLRTGESIFIDDAAAESSFSADPYIRAHGGRSILCMPLMNQAKLTGALYLENNLAARAFSPARIAVLKLLASQAAISLENARLYRDLAEREAKIRRLVDANIIGIIVWNADGDILEANDAFLHMVGYERDDLVSGRVRWRNLTPPELHQGDEQALAEAMQTGRAQPFEKEYIRKDGSRVPVMVGAATFEASRKEGVAFVLDLTERKQAEEKVHESERRYREVQTALAHANRVATMGQLTASIAHEVNQPIAATVTNAQAALRWLGAQPPDIDEVEQVLSRIIKDANRAGDVLGRIRGLIRKTPPQKEPVDINEAIREVIELTRGEATKSGASVQTQLAEGLPFIEGDRVELQQVLLNLIVNAIDAMSGVSDGVRQLLIGTGKADSNCVLVTVRDSGPGFAPHTAESVFAPFYTTKPTGLGMGLSICRSIIDAHGGRLWASANQPSGAVVQFTVPAHPAFLS